MLRYDGRRADAATNPLDLLLDAAIAAVEWCDEVSASVSAMLALACEAIAARRSACVIRAAGRDGEADEILLRAEVALNEGVKLRVRGLPTLRYDGRLRAEGAEIGRPPIRGANAAERQTQHRPRSRSRG